MQQQKIISRRYPGNEFSLRLYYLVGVATWTWISYICLPSATAPFLRFKKELIKNDQWFNFTGRPIN
jgi:hypothetical protein